MLKMKFLLAGIVAAFGFVLAMIGADVFVYDQTWQEALRGSWNQAKQSLLQLLGLAWQYKFVTIVFFAVVMAVLYVRRVPEIRNQ